MTNKIDPNFRDHPEAVSYRQQQDEAWRQMFAQPYIGRPEGSNADHWHLFLSEHKDALPYVAVQIAEAIEDAERRGSYKLPGHDETMANLDVLTIRK